MEYLFESGTCVMYSQVKPKFYWKKHLLNLVLMLDDVT